MKCLECQNAVDSAAAACPVCDCPLDRRCDTCRSINRPQSKFCTTCGHSLALISTPSPSFDRSASLARPISGPATIGQDGYGSNSERKLVTVLFSDLTGYSALCERLDPEDVREMMNLVFKEIVGIIIRYEGYIDRIIGDEVLSVFGLPRTHEDDPVRAILAAVDIHDSVSRMTGRFNGRLGKPLAMHSGITTDLVVTGDPVNRASLLTNLAITGEILVGTCTMPSTSGFFFLEKRQPKKGRGTAETIDAYRVVSTLREPDKIRRVLDLRARLIGRGMQLKDLHPRLGQLGVHHLRRQRPFYKGICPPFPRRGLPRQRKIL